MTVRLMLRMKRLTMNSLKLCPNRSAYVKKRCHFSINLMVTCQVSVPDTGNVSWRKFALQPSRDSLASGLSAHPAAPQDFPHNFHQIPLIQGLVGNITCYRLCIRIQNSDRCSQISTQNSQWRCELADLARSHDDYANSTKVSRVAPSQGTCVTHWSLHT